MRTAIERDMNELQKELNHIADVVVSSCLTTMSLQGEELVTKEDILNSKNKKQNIVKARHILAFVLYRWGFTYSTIGGFLHCTKSSISKMVSAHENYKTSNRAYLLACNSINKTLEGNYA